MAKNTQEFYSHLQLLTDKPRQCSESCLMKCVKYFWSRKCKRTRMASDSERLIDTLVFTLQVSPSTAAAAERNATQFLSQRENAVRIHLNDGVTKLIPKPTVSSFGKNARKTISRCLTSSTDVNLAELCGVDLYRRMFFTFSWHKINEFIKINKWNILPAERTHATSVKRKGEKFSSFQSWKFLLFQAFCVTIILGRDKELSQWQFVC